MDEISKKELLAAMGISYGQLYRWKREGLIPEEWFVKKSAFTGQETFFPREQILARIKAILAMKDTASLEDIRKSLEVSDFPQLKGTILDWMLQQSGTAVIGSLDLSERLASLEAWVLAAGIIEAGTEAAVPEDQLTTLIEQALDQVEAKAADGGGFIAQVSIASTNGVYHFITTTSATTLLGDGALKIPASRQLQIYRDRANAAWAAAH